MSAQFYAKLEVEFSPNATVPEDDFRRFIADHGFTIADLNYHHGIEPGFFEYGMVIRTQESANASRLSEALRKMPMVQEFRLSPMGD
jgi:putative Mg2+ transporter-C (MgtC) family protein